MNMQLGNAGFTDPDCPPGCPDDEHRIDGRRCEEPPYPGQMAFTHGLPRLLLPLLTQIADLILDWEFDMGVETMQGGPWNVEGDQYLCASTQVDLSRAQQAYWMARSGIQVETLTGGLGWSHIVEATDDCCQPAAVTEGAQHDLDCDPF